MNEPGNMHEWWYIMLISGQITWNINISQQIPLIDFGRDDDWENANGELSKCSMAIPGLHHKLCVDHDDVSGDHQIRFAAATDEDMDNSYYHLYGYDEYYYNLNDRDIDDLAADLDYYGDDDGDYDYDYGM